MKIRTKIIWISCLAVLTAILVSDGIIWKLNERTLLNDAKMKGYQNSYVLGMKLREEMDTYSTTINDDIFLDYFLKQQQDAYNIGIRMDSNGAMKEIYNLTMLTPEELEGLDYICYEELSYAELAWNGKSYLVFCDFLGDNFNLYHIEDVSYVQEEQNRLLVYMLIIMFGVTVVIILILTMILKRTLQPLQDLNETTKLMAEGFYDQRVVVNGQDEIGQLGKNFNKMAEAVEARTECLEESEYQKTLFMGNLTHELKTPMTAISGYAQTLLTTRLGEEETREALNYIYQECGRLERLSKKMMKLLELDQDVELEFTEHPVIELFDVAKLACQEILKEKKIQLVVQEQGERFCIDFDLMTDVLVNLIDNAVKASETGSIIYLRADENRIEVEDFGQGIPEEEQGRILEPFYMIDKSRSRKNGGAGLGLALTSLILKQHSVTLNIESEVGKGTRMILQFV
ncbi:MAG: HAMP domain-containing histidine kinase [Lachnospiraceae bacterium]|nr:HAMP domain-containing histidine kinase [Lachnospiraceae bacterium]